jgi:signal transduction histidine kinase
MSLRTKILAAVVGLQLLVVVAGVSVLLFAAPAGDDVPSALITLVSRVQAPPGPRPSARAEAFRELEKGPGVRFVVWLREGEDDRRTPRAVAFTDPPGLVGPDDLERASTLFRAARVEGRPQIREGELALVLDAAPGPESGAPKEGVWLRYSAAGSDRSRTQVVYAVLLAGLLAVSLVAWWLLSRHVVRPLAALADAADRMAGGDKDARVPPTGTGDEIDRTALAFNRMAKEVSEYQAQLEDRVMQALSRIQQAEQHLAIAQRLAATGKLASGIAHEINNPLGGMRNAVRALSRGDLDPAKTAEYLELVQDGLARVEDTVKKVLSFTPRAVQPRPTDLAEVARKAVALARHRAERKSIELVEMLPPAGSAAVFGDPHELQQVALNLLLNAVDAIPDLRGPDGPRAGGRIEIEVSVDGPSAFLRVTDDGAGMTPDVIAQCFDLFFTTKEVGEGTGLGLAVVHNIVTNHGGQIFVDSAPGRGTTFRVMLPREEAPDGAPARAPAAATGEGRA